MESQEKLINRDLIIGWTAIVLILFVTYIGEVFKGERTWLYAFEFMLATGAPAVASAVAYWQNPSNHKLRYYIVSGYFVMYIFVMVTGSTSLVFTYILPMLSLLILYHQESLILGTGIMAMLLNGISIALRAYNGEITMSNSKDVEIQIALLFLCFAGCFAAARLYGDITKHNREYVQTLDDKNKQIQNMTLQSITTIANAIDAKDEYTRGHSQRVSEYSYEIAKELGMTATEAENIRRIALLHDIGKIGVPDSVLNKPGRLTDEEFAIMKSHTVVGAEILKDVKSLPDLDVGTKYHHERYDGKGYPAGLKGDEIPFTARIIGVADAYDAMSSNRVYRKRFSDEEIIAELERCKGTQFDPIVAEAFIRILKKNEFHSLSPDKPIVVVPEENIVKKDITTANTENTGNILEELATSIHIKNVEKDIVKTIKDTDGCLFLIDVDDIGEVNKRLGYLGGDFCLTVIANALQQYRQELLLSRVGGDEFLCFIPGISSIMEAEEEVLKLMNRLHQELRANKELEKVTLSVGVAISAISGRNYSEMYMDADKALYHIKQQGKNGFYIYNDKHKAESKYMSKNDLNNLVKIIQEEYSYSGALQLNYQEFERIYEFVRNIGKRNAQTVQLLLFTIKPIDEKNFAIEDRSNVMQYVERAIVETVRNVDITTRYSSTQQLVMFMNLDEGYIQTVLDRIMKEFYRMYDKKDVTLTYDVANLNL
jgi:diguanylate cyclase (GGDEF)-like protein/putative nucleotidyltransferase with HDIG domain